MRFARPNCRPLRLLAVLSIATLAATGRAQAAAPAPGDQATVQAGFLPRLSLHLDVLAESGILSAGAADGIRRDFGAFQRRDPETLRQAGFEYAIPAVRPQPAEPEPGAMQARPVHEILGTRTVTEDALPETFRRMLAPTKEDGIHFDMFVKEAYLALVKRGLFRNPDGTVDKKAVSEGVQADRALYGIVSAELEAMRVDGSGKRLAAAITAMASYAERRGLVLAPVQVRSGIVHMQACIGAKPGTDPRLYAGSCGRMMAWMGERERAGTVEVQLFDSQTGQARVRHLLTPWDPSYATEAYGQAFTEIQARANDSFWKRHFELYLGTAEANEATLNARYAAGLLGLETAVGRTMKLILCRAQGTRCEGKEVALSDVQAALDESRQLRSSLEAIASPAFKERGGYLDTMRGFEQVLARARMAGLR